jgi:hypothetical protein
LKPKRGVRPASTNRLNMIEGPEAFDERV